MQESLPPPLLLVGLDWGSQNHHFCILDPTGKKLEEGVLPNEANALEAWLNKLLARLAGQADRIAVAIETPRGILVETCLNQGFAVHSINPKQLDRLRDRYYPSGAKDDRRDAFILAESLRTDPNFFRLVIADDPVVLRLREISRHDEISPPTLSDSPISSGISSPDIIRNCLVSALPPTKPGSGHCSNSPPHQLSGLNSPARRSPQSSPNTASAASQPITSRPRSGPPASPSSQARLPHIANGLS